jgi:hypothetical protein
MTTSAQFAIGILAVGAYRIDPARLATVHATVPIIGGMVDIADPSTDSTVTGHSTPRVRLGPPDPRPACALPAAAGHHCLSADQLRLHPAGRRR